MGNLRGRKIHPHCLQGQLAPIANQRTTKIGNEDEETGLLMSFHRAVVATLMSGSFRYPDQWYDQYYENNFNEEFLEADI